MKISYAIPVCNEHKELDQLLTQLLENKREDDEIVVQTDLGNTTKEVYEVIETYKEYVKVVEFPLNKDFAAFKNNLKANCTGDWIFQVDADELISEVLLQNLHLILELNENREVFLVPRINTVEGLTQEHINKWRWNVNESGWVNFPDYQSRLLQNKDNIKWSGKVHEVLVGHTSYVFFPAEENYCILHHKQIEKQEKQNELYNSL